MRLSQLVMNLLDNAIKYTDPNGTVRLELVSELEAWPGWWSKTAGSGLRPTVCRTFFERFYQVDESRSKGGGGLGLSICHWVASAHGGSIDVTSTPGRGSSFRVAPAMRKQSFMC